MDWGTKSYDKKNMIELITNTHFCNYQNRLTDTQFTLQGWEWWKINEKEESVIGNHNDDPQLVFDDQERMSLGSLEMVTDALLEIMEASMRDIPNCHWLKQWTELSKRFAFQVSCRSRVKTWMARASRLPLDLFLQSQLLLRFMQLIMGLILPQLAKPDIHDTDNF